MRKLYVNGLEKNSNKTMIKRASDICSNCINLINNIMIKEALMRNINLIVEAIFLVRFQKVVVL